jgi:hypothetical protein
MTMSSRSLLALRGVGEYCTEGEGKGRGVGGEGEGKGEGKGGGKGEGRGNSTGGSSDISLCGREAETGERGVGIENKTG